MKIKFTFTLGLYFLGLLLLFASSQTIFAQPLTQQTNAACAIPDSGPWPACATGNNASSNSCTIPATGPWPPCATGGSSQATGCKIPTSGPWPPCATGGSYQAKNWTVPLPADGCVIPDEGAWPACEDLTVAVGNFWANQYRVAWRGDNTNVKVVMFFETISIDERSGEETRINNMLSHQLTGAAGAEYVALQPPVGRLFEQQFVTLQLQDTATNKVIDVEAVPMVKPRTVATVHQLELGDNEQVIWNVSPALPNSRVQLHILRPPPPPVVLNEPIGSDRREEVLNMPLNGEWYVEGEFKSAELIVNGWVVGTIAGTAE